MAQIYLAAEPKDCSKAMDALIRLKFSEPGLLWKKAKVLMMAKLIRKETKSEIPLSIAL